MARSVIPFLKENGHMYQLGVSGPGGFPDAALIAIGKIYHIIGLRLLRVNGIKVDDHLCFIERPGEKNDLEELEQIVLDSTTDFGDCLEKFFHNVYESSGWTVERFPIESEIAADDITYSGKDFDHMAESVYMDYLLKYPEASKHKDVILESIEFSMEDDYNVCQEVMIIRNPRAEKFLGYIAEHPEMNQDSVIQEFRELLKMALLPFPCGTEEEVNSMLRQGKTETAIFYYSDEQCYLCDSYSANPLYIAAAAMLGMVMSQIEEKYKICSI